MAPTRKAAALRPEMLERGSTAYVVLLAGVAALGGLLFGYDTAVISGAIGLLTDHFHLDPQLEKGWAAACALVAITAGPRSGRWPSSWATSPVSPCPSVRWSG